MHKIQAMNKVLCLKFIVGDGMFISRELLRAFAIAKGNIKMKHTTFRDLESGPVIRCSKKPKTSKI